MECSYQVQEDTLTNQPFGIATPEERRRITASRHASGDKVGQSISALIIAKDLASRFDFLVRPAQKLWSKLTGRPPQDDTVTRMMRTKFPPKSTSNRSASTPADRSPAPSKPPPGPPCRPSSISSSDPRSWAKPAALVDPAQFDALVWEALRFVPISPSRFRQTPQEYALPKGRPHATTSPPGTNVPALTQSALFDEKDLDNPERFPPGRNRCPYRNFGYGAPECLGKYVGMGMIPEIGSDCPMAKSYELTWAAPS
jgi:hypothetical protein